MHTGSTITGGDAKPPRAARDLFGLVGTTVAEKYAVDSVIGEGGYGVVYAARHLLIGRPIALKCMKPLGTSAEDTAHATGLFLREAQVLFGMGHPGIVRLYDVGTLTTGMHEVPYAVLELVEGRSLEQDIDLRAAEGRHFTRGELEQLFVGVLDALAFTHAAGVAHRDLKPSNIMLIGTAEGTFRTKVLDFGVARFVARDTKHSTGMTGFTPAYAAPEQWSEGFGDPGPATDVFSVALTLAEACTLKTVMGARTPAQIFGAVMSPGRKVVVAGRADLPSSLQLVIDRALQVQPAARYASAREMLADVQLSFTRNAVAPETMGPPSNVTAPRPTSAASFAPGPHVSQPPAMGAHPSMPPTARAPDGYDLSQPMHPSHPSRLPEGPNPNQMTAPSPLLVAGTGPVLAVAPAKSRTGLAVACVLLAAVAAGATATAVWSMKRHRRVTAQLVEASAAAAPRASASASAAPSETVTLSPIALPTGTQFTTAQIVSAVMASKTDLTRCQRAVVVDGASAVADASFFVTIHPTGFVWNYLDLDEIDPLVDPAKNDPAKNERWAHRCLAGVVGALRFPTHTKDDLAGVVIKLRFRPNSPDDTPAPEAAPTLYVSSWVKETPPKMDYPVYEVTVRTFGRIVTFDYKDGTGVCMVYDDNLKCRWVQIDSNGRTTFKRQPDGAVFSGRWGFFEDDHKDGTWKLTLKGAAAAKAPKKAR